MEPRFFHVRQKPMTNWGDYGYTLQHGMGHMLPRREGLILLLRTGPFIPPITFPAWPSFDLRGAGVVVPDSVREALEGSGLTGIAFQSVLKGRIVPIAWQEWDLKAERPPVHPESSEPEGYIVEGTHSTETSDAMGNLWEIVPKQVDWLERLVDHDEDDRGIVQFRFHRDKWDETDFFSIKPYAPLFCSQQAKSWLDTRYSECVCFPVLEVA